MIEKKWIMGLWKFTQDVSITLLSDLAQEWSREDQRYLQLYIRKVSNDQIGIGFTYELPCVKAAQEEYRDYKEQVRDRLTKRFGDEFVGYDIACPVWSLQGAAF
jgi:hypothetical protein